MKKLVLLLAIVLLCQGASAQEAARWARHAANTTITRDDWGIAHVHGRTDADAVFGMIYAQAEDDFNRIETNYLTALGRTAEAEGERAIWTDLRQRLFIDPDSLKKAYAASPAWLKALMDGWADGLNFYLARNPEVHPKVITRFEPWMALSFTEGSIGGDIERINTGGLASFYGGVTPRGGRRGEGGGGDGEPDTEGLIAPAEPSGSNGIAIAPANTVNHHALLYINPHTSFFFRSELQMSSDEGLNAYGAVTWGQIFIYQGWNATAGWMHTSSGVDNIDEFLETVSERNGRWYYRHGTEELPVASRPITVRYRTATGMADTTFTAYFTRHGPVVRQLGDRWVATALMNSPVNALIQSYSRTKAKNLAAFRKIMELHTNSSNNTIFADAEGNIAYFHSNYIPKRDTSFDWTRPVDGSNPATDYDGVLSTDETPDLFNPASGWLYNSNNWPWSAAGESSLKREDFPVYVETGTAESPRGEHALRLFPGRRDFTLGSLIEAGFDSYMPWFEKPIPALVKAWDAAAPTDTLKRRLADQITILRDWDFRWGVGSVATSLGVYWGSDVRRLLGGGARGAGMSTDDYMASPAGQQQMLAALATASDRLISDFGSWRTPWGEINRFQRLDDSIVSHFDDAKASIAVPFASAVWGSLASFGARAYPNTKKWYGTSGNSFIAAVEFGDSVRARAITAGGESGDPASKHFNDQAGRYASGDLRPVYFYPNQLTGHTERVYHPGS
ncbi:MAG: penicillin acylase family protein [Gemmatimonadales bacterium]|nr:penicillin acylase family protein [Gemmatimonadales bacterium]